MNLNKRFLGAIQIKEVQCICAKGKIFENPDVVRYRPLHYICNITLDLKIETKFDFCPLI